MEIKNQKLNALFWRPEFYGAVVDGGVPSLYYGLTSGLLRLGHSCSFVSGGRLRLPPGVKKYYIPYSKALRNVPEVLCLPYNKRSIKGVMDIIDKEKPDFIFQHNHDFHYGGSVVKYKSGLPFLLHVDSVEYWIKKNWGKLYLPKLLKWAEEIQWEHSDVIFVISDIVKKQLVELGVEESKIVLNPNGVNPDQFSPKIDGSIIRKKLKIEDKFICGFSGTFGQWHGLDIIAKTIKILKNKIENVFFLFVGDGNLRQSVEDIISKDNVNNYAHITGLVNYEEIPLYLSACDVLLSPCVHSVDGSEFFNSPIKLFEYMAMEKPIVATSIGQQGDVIDDKINGLYCEEKSPEDLAQKIYKIYKNPELGKHLGKNARIKVLSNFDWKFNAQRIIDAYRFALDKRR